MLDVQALAQGAKRLSSRAGTPPSERALAPLAWFYVVVVLEAVTMRNASQIGVARSPESVGRGGSGPFS